MCDYRPLTNQELGYFYEFKEGSAPVSEAEVRAANIKLLAAADNLRPLYNPTGPKNGGKSKASRPGGNDDMTRREWKGPVVWHASEDTGPGATARKSPSQSTAALFHASSTSCSFCAQLLVRDGGRF